MDLNTIIPSLDFGTLLYYLFGLTLLDFVIGTAVSIGRGLFRWDMVASFLRSHVAFRVVPIAATEIFAHGVPGITPQLDLLWVAVYGSCVAYLGETIASIVSNLGQPDAHPSQSPQ